MFLRIGTLAVLGISFTLGFGSLAARADSPYQQPFGLSTLDINSSGEIAVDGKLLVESALGTESWDECNGSVGGNYIGLPCIHARGMANEFVAFLRANMISCSAAGLANVGGGSVSAVHIVHDGTLADTRHNKWSLHAAGRAVDVLQLALTTSKGTRSFAFHDTSSNPRGQDRRFYEGFRQCWHRLQKNRGCPNRASGNPVGTIGWEDAHHRNHHLHTSMPFCPNRGHWFETALGTDEAEE